MEYAMMITLVLTLLTGFSQEQTLLPPGPINQAVGETAHFVTLPLPQAISAIRWHFNNSIVVTYTHPGSVNVNSSYIGRVILNYTTGALELRNLTTADTGEYQLTITFTDGLGNKDYTLLQVFEPVFSLGITSPEGNVIEFASVNFTCKGDGTITKTIWMKGDEILAPSSSITFLEDNRTMMISPVKRSDSGNYHCEISNPISSSNDSFSITVNYGPDVRILGVPTFEDGSDILLYCSTDSVPPAIVTWTMNGMSIGNTSLYVIEKSNPSNSGDYNCTCWNSVTGITVSAVHVLTMKAVSSRLGPSEVAVIILSLLLISIMVVLGVLGYVFRKRFKKPDDTVRNATVNRSQTQQTNPTFSRNTVMAPSRQSSADDTSGEIYEDPENNDTSGEIYENPEIVQSNLPPPPPSFSIPPRRSLTRERPPSPPKRREPPLPENRLMNASGVYYNTHR